MENNIINFASIKLEDFENKLNDPEISDGIFNDILIEREKYIDFIFFLNSKTKPVYNLRYSYNF